MGVRYLCETGIPGETVLSDESEAEGRRSTRYLIRVPVQVGFGEHVLALQSQNVSFDGIFVRCGALPKVDTEVTVRVRLPFGFGSPSLKFIES